MEQDIACDHLDGWLETPRIFFMPMSLSLVLHLAFREFQDDSTDKLCEQMEWQSIHVRSAQNGLVAPYLEKVLHLVALPKARPLWDTACS
jgi:hypothetical protein